MTWLCAGALLVLALAGGAVASSTSPEQTKQDGLFRFEYPRGMIGSTTVAFASFSEAPDDNFKGNISTFTELRVLLVMHPVGDPSWEVDPGIGRCTNLQTFYAPGLLRGVLPSQFGLLSDCRLFDVRSAALTGTIPSELGLLTNAAAVQLSNNQALSGSIPSQWGQLTALVGVELADCSLHGAIPSQLGLLRNASDVLMNSNALSGTLPPVLFPAWSKLRILAISGNRLSGTLPSQLGACTTVERIHSSSNDFTGALPSQLGQLGALGRLELQHNQLEGTLPSQLGRLRRLFFLQLQYNKLTGSVPVEFGQLTALSTLRLDHNALWGSIPAPVFALPALSDVHVSHNALWGSIPAGAGADAWRGDCDYSGLDDSECDFDCLACGAGQFQLVECGTVGQDPKCAEWWAVVVALVGCVAVCLVLAKSVLPPEATTRQLFMTGGVSSFAVVDLVVDYLFALNAHGVVQTLSFVVWGGVLALSLLATLGLGFAHRLWSHPVRLVGACVLCTFNASCLTTLATTNVPGLDPPTLRRHKDVVMQVVLWLVLVETLFQGALQFASVVLGDTSTITLMSLCFSVFHVVSMFTVSVVLVLAREPKSPALSAPESERVEDGAKARKRRRRGLVATLMLCLVPAIVLGPPEVAHVGRQGAVAGDTGLILAPSRPSRVSWGEHAQAGGTTSVAKSEIACGPDLFDIRLPYVCTLGRLLAVFSFEQLGTEPVDLDLVTSDAPYVFAFIALSWQPVTTALGQLTNLVALLLESADVQLPSQIGLLSQLMLLRNSYTTFANTVPSEIANARKLVDVSFVENNLEGALPSEIYLLTNIAILDTSGNHDLSGTLPTQLGLLSALFHVDMHVTGIGGPLPSELGNCPMLQRLFFDQTQLSGTIPSQLGRCRALEMLVVSHSHVVGSLPTQIYSLTALTEISVSGISGSLPTDIGALTRLKILRIYSPQFVGTLPTQLGLATALTALELYGGEGGGGSIPSQLARLTGLTRLSLWARELEGTVPSELGVLTALTALSLAHNRLHGSLPSQLARLTLLDSVDITSNNLAGTFPAGLGEAWRSACDHSGVHDKECRRGCSSCALGSIELRSCDAWGNGQMCIPPFVVFVVLACFVGAQVFVVRKVGGVGNARPKLLLQGALFATISATHLLFDWAFALDAGRAIQIPSAVILCVALLARLILVASELLRMQNQNHGADIAAGMFLAVLAVAVCVVDPFTLKRALRSGEGLAAKLAAARVLKRVLVVVLLSDVPMAALQLVRLGLMGTPNWVVVTALVCTLLSLAVGSRYWPCARAPPVPGASRMPQGSLQGSLQADLGL